MSISSFDAVWSLGATKLIIPVGATAAIFMQPQAGQVAWTVNWIGGSYEILPSGIGSSFLNMNFGTTLNGNTLVALSGNGYPILSSASPLYINGPANFYLSSLGATGICALLLHKAQNF